VLLALELGTSGHATALNLQLGAHYGTVPETNTLGRRVVGRLKPANPPLTLSVMPQLFVEGAVNTDNAKTKISAVQGRSRVRSGAVRAQLLLRLRTVASAAV
jgi:hypothetical protein